MCKKVLKIFVCFWDLYSPVLYPSAMIWVNYIGETSRTTETRIKEEQRNFKTLQNKPNHHFSDKYNDLGYINHIRETGHKFKFDKTRVLTFRRKLLEGLYNQQNQETATNLKAGTLIDKC
jgi:hypothetical protein